MHIDNNGVGAGTTGGAVMDHYEQTDTLFKIHQLGDLTTRNGGVTISNSGPSSAGNPDLGVAPAPHPTFNFPSP